jgi:hypothetical protein
MNKDISILRDLAKRYMEVCARPEMKTRRDLWRKHNSLKDTIPPIYTRAFAWQEMPESKLACEDEELRQYENFFRYRLFWDSLNDDSIFEPWIKVGAVSCQEGWGIDVDRHFSGEEGGSYKVDYALKNPEDIRKLVEPKHEVDEQKTSARVNKLRDAIGDLITINIDHAPQHRAFGGDISTYLGLFRGIENIMLDMYDNPEWLHSVVSFMSKGILKVHKEAEEAGDWGLGGARKPGHALCRGTPRPGAERQWHQEKPALGFHGGPGVYGHFAGHARRVFAEVSTADPPSFRPGRLRLLRRPDEQNRHAAPDSESAPDRGFTHG